MVRIKILIITALFIALMNIGLSVQGTEEKGGDQSHHSTAGPVCDLELVVRGAVEDQSWMGCRTPEEVGSVLGRYYTGDLLAQLAGNCWKFIERPTDWYSVSRVIELRVLHDDGQRAVVEALIGIEDLDTGYNETGKGLFAMLNTPEGWRINYTAFSWGR